ncbi:hypothetical protein LOTGIDRAFT_194459 [Lottia gigantea]|uniref:Adenosine 5'-monophosphoramidase HINT3 n=1 Tax=Lottia gigantea TaxID=225164 RepID=V3Z7V8_LOTGI|nr:hypothetical protein LOTGIDRAFT_194459 [Lottia gigantea]ESO86908.1 hypothetical protein LOTGIDRAFT_194459 [Lottia gigantea]
MSDKKCIFCEISNGNDPKTRIIYQEEDYVVFKDIKPCTSHHYLVIPKKHIPNPKQLTSKQLPIVEKLESIGRQVITEQGGNVEDVRMGFHWPPFNSVQHLHLHVISNTDEMGWIARGIFKPDSFWFVCVDWVKERLRKMEVRENTSDSNM